MVNHRGSLRFCGALCHWLARGPKELKMWWGVAVCYTLYYLLEPVTIEKGNTLFLSHLKALGALHFLMLDKLHAPLGWDPINRCALGHGLLRLCLNPPLA
jgi:hypothetical protein